MSGLTFLLVHGSWHGPWCWDGTVAALAARGHSARTVALPSCGPDVTRLGGLADDARAVETAAGAIGGPVIVVGHSYGGAAITHARPAPNVRRLVYLGAFMPDAGQSLVDFLPPGELPPYVNMGPAYSTMAFAQVAPLLYGDCAPEDVAAALPRLVPQASAAPATPVGEPAWRHVPSTYILLKRDRAVPPELQAMFARQAGEVVELDGSHNFFASRGDLLAETLISIAARSAVPA